MTRSAITASPVLIDTDDVRLAADLRLPADPIGLIAFAHGSGSSRFSSRNILVAESLVRHGYGTLLTDLLSISEEAVDRQTAHLRFDVDMLGRRMATIVDWLADADALRELPLGLFGASTGAAAALIAAAARPDRVRAVVSRGGRPDLAASALPRVVAPTLLLVGSLDDVVLLLNRQAKAQMHAAEVAIETIAGASHLFEEPGALEKVAARAAAWFDRHVPAFVR